MNTFLGNSNRELELVHALAENFNAVDSLSKTASVDGSEKSVEDVVEPMNSLASVVETLVKCAETLEQAGEPTEKVDSVLSFIEKEFFSTPSAAE